MASPFDFFSPWEPAPVSKNARTYAQWLASFGANSGQIVNAIKKSFALVSGQLAGRIANAALAFAGKLEDMQTRGKSFKMERSEIPRNPQLPEAYRVVVTVRLRNPDCPSTARSADCYDYLTVVLDFSFNPTNGDIQNAAKKMVQTTLPEGGSAKAQAIKDWKVSSMDINALERRT